MSKAKKRSVNELLRLACIHAEQDRHSYSLCDGGEAGKDAAELSKEIHAYRMKRWGRTQHEADIDGATPIDIKDIWKNKP